MRLAAVLCCASCIRPHYVYIVTLIAVSPIWLLHCQGCKYLRMFFPGRCKAFCNEVHRLQKNALCALQHCAFFLCRCAGGWLTVWEAFGNVQMYTADCELLRCPDISKPGKRNYLQSAGLAKSGNCDTAKSQLSSNAHFFFWALLRCDSVFNLSGTIDQPSPKLYH